MKHLKTYNEFGKIQEDAVKGQESDVFIDDVYIAKQDSEIKGAEILGVIKSSETESEFKDYFYAEYGEGHFTKEEISKLVAFYNEYDEEANIDKVEAEKEAESEEDTLGDTEGEAEPTVIDDEDEDEAAIADLEAEL